MFSEDLIAVVKPVLEELTNHLKTNTLHDSLYLMLSPRKEELEAGTAEIQEWFSALAVSLYILFPTWTTDEVTEAIRSAASANLELMT